MTVFTAIVLLTLFVQGTNCCCCFLYLASKLVVAIRILADRSVCLRTLTQERKLCESLSVYVQTRSSYCPNRTLKLYCNDIYWMFAWPAVVCSPDIPVQCSLLTACHACIQNQRHRYNVYNLFDGLTYSNSKGRETYIHIQYKSKPTHICGSTEHFTFHYGTKAIQHQKSLMTCFFFLLLLAFFFVGSHGMSPIKWVLFSSHQWLCR